MSQRNIGVGFSSQAALRGIVSEAEDQVKKTKGVVQRVPKTEKKKSRWQDSNAGVHERALRDVAQDAAEKVQVADARPNLQRKSKKYDELVRGKNAGFSEQERAELLVDFDEKLVDDSSEAESDGAEGPSAVRPNDDPEVEYIDEHGRSRWARRSEIPEEYRPLRSEEDKQDDGEVIHRPTHMYRVVERSAEDQAQILAETEKPQEVHYDPTKENRAMGAGFIRLSNDEETRKQQLEDLRRETAATNEIRAANQAPRTQVDGMQADVPGQRGLGKRTRGIEERRKLLSEKRAKKQKVNTTQEATASSSTPVVSSTTASSSATQDPFAALEAQSSGASANHEAAVAFLAQVIPPEMGRPIRAN
ncbi:hypothetical protein C8Q80DRAFT_633433 [Daedaleopsis nitida]|nr:hypothetical protein C8Q80DRAFT_633433 [Daedaleopsis nitida]